MVSRAQGTIEYLVILAIVVVISLVVVVTVTNFSGQSSVSQSTDKLNDLVGGGVISVVEAVSDFEDVGFLSLKNNSGGVLTLKSISTSGGGNDYDFPWGPGNKELFDISGLCVCESGQSTKTCNFTFTIITSNGLEKKYLQTITLKCLETPVPNKPPISPVLLDCFNLDDDPIQICSLQDLNRIREKLNGNYVLLKNIDASETQTWDDGKGFTPIGTSVTPFSGVINGDSYNIQNLVINRPTENIVGLFAFNQGVIENVGIESGEIIGKQYVGGLVGIINNGGVIRFAHNNANITGSGGTGFIGGICGVINGGKIINSYNEGTVIGNRNVGGICGAIYNSTDELIGVYNKGNISISISNENLGGIVGEMSDGKIINAYNQGNVGESTDRGGYVGGIVGTVLKGQIEKVYSSNNEIKGSYWVGGAFGVTNGQTTVSNSFSTSQVQEINPGLNTLFGGYRDIAQTTMSNLFWNKTSEDQNCYFFLHSVPSVYKSSNEDCFTTNNSILEYYGVGGIPFTVLGFGDDGNWVAQENGFPKLFWE